MNMVDDMIRNHMLTIYRDLGDFIIEKGIGKKVKNIKEREEKLV